MISQRDIDRLREQPIEEVASYVDIVEKHGKAICPFHKDSTPSLSFSKAHNIYKCFVCGARGDTISLVMKTQECTFREACKLIADKAGIILGEDTSDTQSIEVKKVERKPAPQPPSYLDIAHLSSLVSQPALTDRAKEFLFDERRISPSVVERLGITSIDRPVPSSRNMNLLWFDAPSLLFPYRDIDGRLLSVQARYLGTAPGRKRFQFPQGGKVDIFNLPELSTLKAGDPLFITEGVTDCLALLSAGYKAIAIPSATSLCPERLKSVLRPLTDSETPYSLHIFPDQDAPGEALFTQLQSLFPDIVRHSLPEGYKDVGGYFAEIKQPRIIRK